MKTLSDTIIFNDLLKALDTGMVVYLKNGISGYFTLDNFGFILNGNVPTISMKFYNIDNYYSVIPSEGYSDSDLYTPTNFVIQEASSSPK